MNYSSLTAKLFSRTTKGMKLGLERMAGAARELGDPQEEIPCIHVAGTNGKGSVCAMSEAMLRGCGFSTGLFTKPHLVRLEERFLLDGSPVEESEMLDIYADIDPLVDRYDLTFFEATTLIAFELFRRREVDWAIYETGLGGRLDSTNVVNPEMTVIASLGIEHTQYLGDTIEQIAGEKLGIVKGRTPLIMAEPPCESVRELAGKVCRERKAPLTFALRRELSELSREGNGWAFAHGGARFRIPLAGPHQPLNALCAIKAVALLLPDMGDCLAGGLARTYVPARFQVVEVRGRRCVLDVGHNPDAARIQVETFASMFPGEPLWLAVGIMGDKDYGSMIRTYCGYPHLAGLVLTVPSTARAAAASALLEAVPEMSRAKVTVSDTVASAVETVAENSTGLCAVVGSFYTVGEAMQALGVAPYPEANV